MYSGQMLISSGHLASPFTNTSTLLPQFVNLLGSINEIERSRATPPLDFISAAKEAQHLPSLSAAPCKHLLPVPVPSNSERQTPVTELDPDKPNAEPNTNQKTRNARRLLVLQTPKSDPDKAIEKKPKLHNTPITR